MLWVNRKMCLLGIVTRLLLVLLAACIVLICVLGLNMLPLDYSKAKKSSYADSQWRNFKSEQKLLQQLIKLRAAREKLNSNLLHLLRCTPPDAVMQSIEADRNDFSLTWQSRSESQSAPDACWLKLGLKINQWQVLKNNGRRMLRIQGDWPHVVGQKQA